MEVFVWLNQTALCMHIFVFVQFLWGSQFVQFCVVCTIWRALPVACLLLVLLALSSAELAEMAMETCIDRWLCVHMLINCTYPHTTHVCICSWTHYDVMSHFGVSGLYLNNYMPAMHLQCFAATSVAYLLWHSKEGPFVHNHCAAL